MDRNLLYLAQSDTTVGYLSGNRKKIAKAKDRDEAKPMLLEADSLSTLKNIVRIPEIFKKRIRRERFATYIYKGRISKDENCNNGIREERIHKNRICKSDISIRVVGDKCHIKFLKKFSTLYSSSANVSGGEFDMDEAISRSEVLVIDGRGIFESIPSKIYKINRRRIERIR